MNSLKQAIVASLTEHPDAQKYFQQALAQDPAQLMDVLAQKQTLTKEDFFATDDQGKPFIDSVGAWKNFEKISEIIRLGGDKLTYEDFTRPIGSGTRSLLDSAKLNNGVAKVFTFEVWQGRYDEMEKLWYKLPSFERNKSQGVVTLDLKRKMLAVEGRETPEDLLAKAGITPFDIRNAAVSDYSYTEVNKKLRLAGDYFRKEYVLMPDGAGDTIFDSRREAFSKFDAILKIMQSNGERLEVRDYTRQLGNAQSLLAKAAEQKALDKVFAPAQWTDRLQDMLTLWSNVLDAWKTSPMATQDFDNAYAEAEGMTYAKRFKSMEVNGKSDLLTPLNEGLNEKPVLPLGLKVVWDNFDAIHEHLRGKDEALTTSDLRKPSGQMGDSCLISAAKYGHFDKAVEIAKQCGEPIAMADFLSKDAHGNTLINILAEKRQLSQVFTVDAWVGHVGDMKELWSHVAAVHRKQVNFSQVETGVKQATLKQQKKGGGIKIRPH